MLDLGRLGTDDLTRQKAIHYVVHQTKTDRLLLLALALCLVTLGRCLVTLGHTPLSLQNSF
jgi:hypothetical protein